MAVCVLYKSHLDSCVVVLGASRPGMLHALAQGRSLARGLRGPRPRGGRPAAAGTSRRPATRWWAR